MHTEKWDKLTSRENKEGERENQGDPLGMSLDVTSETFNKNQVGDGA